MHNKFRVVSGKGLGYQAQIKYWWFPLCFFPYGTNSFFTLKQARVYIAERVAGTYKKPKVKKQVVWTGSANDLPDHTKPIYN